MNYIKSILMALLGKYAKSHKKQIEKGQKLIDHAQEQFNIAIKEAELSADRYDEVIAECREKINELRQVEADAQSRKVSALAFKNKMSTFVTEEN